MPTRAPRGAHSDAGRREAPKQIQPAPRAPPDPWVPLAPDQTESGMSETTPAPQPTPAAPPPLVVNIQYVKDLSFEVPGAPTIYSTLRAQPQVAINLDVQARRIVENGNNYEVTLMIRAEAHDPNSQGNGQAPAAVVFIAELTYAGVFTLSGLPENAIEPVLLVECPRILFPFARNILADVTRDGGFPPVLLQPIDFVQLWQSRRAQQAQGAAVGGSATV